jgi:hypothetical protein
MSRLFESFEFLDRGWDVRVLESQSLRSIFLWLLPLVFSVGAMTASVKPRRRLSQRKTDGCGDLALAVTGFDIAISQLEDTARSGGQ